MLRYVIASHANLSEGFLSALKLLLGERGDIETISAYIDEEPLDSKVDSVINKYDANDTVVVFTDLYGGSINQHFAKMLYGGSGRKIHLIAGGNLALMIEVILGMSGGFDEKFVLNAIEQSRNQMVYMNNVLPAAPGGVVDD